MNITPFRLKVVAICGGCTMVTRCCCRWLLYSEIFLVTCQRDCTPSANWQYQQEELCCVKSKPHKESGETVTVTPPPATKARAPPRITEQSHTTATMSDNTAHKQFEGARRWLFLPKYILTNWHFSEIQRCDHTFWFFPRGHTSGGIVLPTDYLWRMCFYWDGSICVTAWQLHALWPFPSPDFLLWKEQLDHRTFFMLSSN